MNVRTNVQATEDPEGRFSFTLSESANPPFDKFEAMMEIEPKFKQSWERKRKDMQDQSGSSYDLSLASYAAIAGWTDQDMVDLLIASRRKHNDDLKLRHDYYDRTIRRARTFIQRTRAAEEIDEYAVDVGEEEEPETIDDNKRLALLQNISALFQVNIKRIVKYVSDPPQYRLETTIGSIMLGDVSNLIEQGKLRKKFADVAGKYIPRFKPERWDNMAQALLNVCELEGIGDEATTEGAARAWVEGYLEAKPPVTLEEIDDVMKDVVAIRMPFKRDGRVYIFGSDMIRWLKINELEKINSKELGTILRAYGAAPDKFNYKDGDARTSKSVWILPPNHR